jgi:hypothetical protein
MPRTSVLALIAAAALPVVGAGPCSNAWEDCSETMCCGTPYFKCIEKNKATTKDGKKVKAYAQCRKANGTSGCPCANPPCFDYQHDFKSKVKMPWTCIELTGGCSPAYKECGPGKDLSADAKKNWHGVPCCQWGCTCNYSMKWSAQCQPPKGMYACTKNAQKQKEQKHKNPFEVNYEVPEEVPRARPFPWFAAGAGTVLLASAFAVALRKKRRSQGSVYDEALVDAEAEADSS